MNMHLDNLEKEEITEETEEEKDNREALKEMTNKE
jgi:hypothetical protein